MSDTDDPVGTPRRGTRKRKPVRRIDENYIPREPPAKTPKQQDDLFMKAFIAITMLAQTPRHTPAVEEVVDEKPPIDRTTPPGDYTELAFCRDGLGLFAKKRITKGTLVTTYGGTTYNEGEARPTDINPNYQLCLGDGAIRDGSTQMLGLCAQMANKTPLTGAGPAINHHCKFANVYIGGVNVIASRDIAAGEQLLLNYGRVPIRCSCGFCPQRHAKAARRH